MRRAAAFALICALAAPAPAAAARPMPDKWVPVAGVKQNADRRISIAGERAIFTADGIRVEVELLDAPRRALFLRSAGAGDADPFSEDMLRLKAWTFLVRLTNDSDEELNLRPQSIFFITRRPLGQATPCDFTCLLAAYERAGLEGPVRDRLMKASLDTSEVIVPDGKISKLLVFTAVPDRFKQFALEFSSVQQASREHRFRIYYEPVK